MRGAGGVWDHEVFARYFNWERLRCWSTGHTLNSFYGRFSLLPKRAETIPQATFGLALIFLCMLALSVARTGFKGSPPEIFDRLYRGGRKERGSLTRRRSKP